MLLLFCNTLISFVHLFPVHLHITLERFHLEKNPAILIINNPSYTKQTKIR